jgi:hypothetical protein
MILVQRPTSLPAILYEEPIYDDLTDFLGAETHGR